METSRTAGAEAGRSAGKRPLVDPIPINALQLVQRQDLSAGFTEPNGSLPLPSVAGCPKSSRCHDTKGRPWESRAPHRSSQYDRLDEEFRPMPSNRSVDLPIPRNRSTDLSASLGEGLESRRSTSRLVPSRCCSFLSLAFHLQRQGGRHIVPL